MSDIEIEKYYVINIIIKKDNFVHIQYDNNLQEVMLQHCRHNVILLQ